MKTRPPLSTRDSGIACANVAPHHLVDFNFADVDQNHFKKIYRAKTPRAQRKFLFFELGVLCAFARDIVFFKSEFQTRLANFGCRIATFDGRCFTCGDRKPRDFRSEVGQGLCGILGSHPFASDRWESLRAARTV
jgi:hypothetical protein